MNPVEFEAVNEAFEKKFQEDAAFRSKIGAGIAASLKDAGLESPPDETAAAESLVAEGVLAAAKGQVITAKAFWWGYHFVIPEKAMKDFTSAGSVVTTFMSLGGSVIAASGGSLAPVVAVVAAFAAAELALMQLVDRGKGVYLSATWASPAAIIPTPIK